MKTNVAVFGIFNIGEWNLKFYNSLDVFSDGVLSYVFLINFNSNNFSHLSFCSIIDSMIHDPIGSMSNQWIKLVELVFH